MHSFTFAWLWHLESKLRLALSQKYFVTFKALTNRKMSKRRFANAKINVRNGTVCISITSHDNFSRIIHCNFKWLYLLPRRKQCLSYILPFTFNAYSLKTRILRSKLIYITVTIYLFYKNVWLNQYVKLSWI